jgi:lipoprotein-anchoring transpeptidase ErfK/SrfK
MSSETPLGDVTRKFRLGFLGAWGLFVAGLILAASVAAGEWQNWRDSARLRRLGIIDKMIAERVGSRMGALQAAALEMAGKVDRLRTAVQNVDMTLDDTQDTDQTIVVSTEENRLYVRRAGKKIFEAVCSTGKGKTVVQDGKSMLFETPTGKFRIRSKEENPVWVPPDWHYLEEARKKGKRVVRLDPGEAIDARTGAPVDAGAESGGIWSLLRSSRTSRGRVITVRNNTVVEVGPDGARELPAGKVIEVGGSIVVPPYGTPQRKFEKTLGKYRLNLGGGYAIHGTLMTNQLGRSVTHGCVRLGDADIEALYGMAKVGDQVLIY